MNPITRTLSLALVAVLAILAAGCTPEITAIPRGTIIVSDAPEESEGNPDGMTFQEAVGLDLTNFPELFDLDVGAAQVVYSDGLLPGQGLFDWYAETGYYQTTEGQPSAMLTADTVIWAYEGDLTAAGVEWTLYVTREGSPVALDPSEVVDHCIVHQVLEGETIADPYTTQFLGEIPVNDSAVSLTGIDMVDAHTQDLDYYTTRLSCTMLPNTSGETLLVSAVFSGVINPTLTETGQEIEVEMDEHESLVFYHLPEIE